MDLVVTIVSDHPAYMSFDLEHFTVTMSNNGPDAATSVALAVDHPLADIPFETSATCQPVPGPNPNGPAVCPPAREPRRRRAFTRVGYRAPGDDPLPSQPGPGRGAVRQPVALPGANGAPTGQDTSLHGRAGGELSDHGDGVGSAETDSLGPTNTATTNIFLYPPVIEYKVAITGAPATAAPGTIADFDFEVQSTGDQPSDKLKLSVTIQGLTGTMLPLTASNNPNGGNGSTLPNTVLQSIDCVSDTLGSYPPGSVFPAVRPPGRPAPPRV